MGDFWGEILAIQIASNISFALILLFLLMQLDRLVSKELYEKVFYKDGLYFPTTNYLLYIDSYYTPDYTSRIHQKIKSDFGISIPSGHEEKNNETLSRQYVREAMSHIRSYVGKGKLAGMHNMEYGFFRNFAGGILLALLMSVINVGIFGFFYPSSDAYVISLGTFFVYLALSVFSKKMIDSAGKSYAKVLIQEYMSK